MRSASLKYASPLKKGKSHAIWVLSETLSPPIEKFLPKIYSCYDRQLYSRLQISHKIETREAITRIYKFGKISRIFIGLLLFHIGKAGNFLWNPNTNTNTFFCGALILRISRQILGQADRVLLQRGVGWKIGKIGTD